MKKYEWFNTDYILAKVNWHLSNHAYELIKPNRANGIPYEEGTFWLIDLHGEIVLKDIDLAEFAEGFNLFKSGELFGFEDFIANTCDGILIKVGHDFESSDCDVCDDLRNLAGNRIGALAKEEIDDINLV